jgi:hypothetical protein
MEKTFSKQIFYFSYFSHVLPFNLPSQTIWHSYIGCKYLKETNILQQVLQHNFICTQIYQTSFELKRNLLYDEKYFFISQQIFSVFCTSKVNGIICVSDRAGYANIEFGLKLNYLGMTRASFLKFNKTNQNCTWDIFVLFMIFGNVFFPKFLEHTSRIFSILVHYLLGPTRI